MALGHEDRRGRRWADTDRDLLEVVVTGGLRQDVQHTGDPGRARWRAAHQVFVDRVHAPARDRHRLRVYAHGRARRVAGPDVDAGDAVAVWVRHPGDRIALERHAGGPRVAREVTRRD